MKVAEVEEKMHNRHFSAMFVTFTYVYQTKESILSFKLYTSTNYLYHSISILLAAIKMVIYKRRVTSGEARQTHLLDIMPITTPVHTFIQTLH